MSFCVIALIWLIYPGVMVLFATFAALCYVAVCIAAFRDNQFAVWLAFVITALLGILSSLSVNHFIQNGFNYFAGNFPEYNGIYLPPYLFLVISLGSAIVVVLHLITWRWLLLGEVGKH